MPKDHSSSKVKTARPPARYGSGFVEKAAASDEIVLRPGTSEQLAEVTAEASAEALASSIDDAAADLGMSPDELAKLLQQR